MEIFCIYMIDVIYLYDLFIGLIVYPHVHYFSSFTTTCEWNGRLLFKMNNWGLENIRDLLKVTVVDRIGLSANWVYTGYES